MLWIHTTRGARRGPSLRGFTLIELLLVMSILGLVLGAGVGILAGLDLESDTAPERVRAALLSAQSAALEEGLPASLRLDPSGRALIATIPRSRTSWHFEGAGDGLSLFGAALIEDGYLGRALNLSSGALDAHAELELIGRGELVGAQGFAIRCYVRYAGGEGGQLLNSGEDFALKLSSDGELIATIALRDLQDPDPSKAAGRMQLKTAPAALEVGRWQQLTLLVDGLDFALYLDGARIAQQPIEGPLILPERTLRLGGRPRSFPGAIDELTLYAYDAREPLPLPQRVEWPAEAPREFRYAADGTLEGAQGKPIELRLGLPGGTQRPLLLNARGITDA